MRREILGRYELADLLGRGGMAEVWAAWDRTAGRRVAVKFLAPYGHPDASAALEERFRREAKLTADLSHPGVPVVHDSGRLDDGRLYLVMELVPGDTLAASLKDGGPFPVQRAATVAAQAAEALAHAHAQGVIHRDIKLSNVMLTPAGAVKVLDFGIAAALEPAPDEPRLTATDATPGTAGFMAPEQAQGRPVAASDLYGLGCVLYELLAGVAPFTAPNAVMLMYQHAFKEPPSVTSHRPDAPAEFADLVMRLLAKKPAARPSADEVRDIGRRWSAGAAGSDETGSVVSLVEQYDRWREADEPGRAHEGYAGLVERLAGSRPVDDPELLACRAGAARCLAMLGRSTEARDAYEALLPFQTRALGAAHVSVFESRYRIGELAAGLGERERARTLLTELRDDQRAAVPGNDPGLVRTVELLARLDRLLEGSS
ncbi:serine/threonine-protein kinase [Kitasatospora sp. NPDC093102]|uniref:serine/threonine-protein kinase n=1 Tax=Kitasatospora sp. NPDC093102 TaxID=3155069 RepID=UPI0034328A25